MVNRKQFIRLVERPEAPKPQHNDREYEKVGYIEHGVLKHTGVPEHKYELAFKDITVTNLDDMEFWRFPDVLLFLFINGYAVSWDDTPPVEVIKMFCKLKKWNPSRTVRKGC